eukprot:2325693-Prymnesium_polylepis.1
MQPTAGAFSRLLPLQDMQLALVVNRVEAVVRGHLERVGSVVDRAVDDENGVEVLQSAVSLNISTIQS